MIKRFPFVLSCDWFSYSCYVPRSFMTVGADGSREALCELYKVYNLGGDAFTCVECKEFSPCFSRSVLMRWNGQDVCSLFFGDKRSPHSLLGVAKVANSFLYYGQWPYYFLRALQAVGWRHVAVKRVDVCCDFELFANGRKPLQFIRDYLSEPTASRCSFIRKSSNKYVATGVRSIAANVVQSVRWGTRESPVQVNLYNKTQELVDVKMKPWIVEKWRQNGLISGVDSFGKAHWVWRVEFSINASQLALRAKDKSKCFDVSLNDVADQASLFNLFRVLLPNYFQFYAVTLLDVKQRHKVRDLEPVTLFDVDTATVNVTTMTLARSIGTGRTERLLASKLIELRGSPRLTDAQREAVAPVIDLLLQRAASLDSVDYSCGEDVIANFLYDLTTPANGSLGKMSRAVAQHHAKRFARLLRASNSQEYADYAYACEALQLDIEALRSKMVAVLQQAPDEAYECWIDEDIDNEWLRDYVDSQPPQNSDMLIP